MLAMHLPGRQKLYTGVAAALMLGGVGFVGAQWAKPAAPLDLAPVSGDAKPVDTKPVEATPKPEAPKTEVEAPKPAPTEVVVAVAGAVKKGGLIHLPLDSRVDDAIKAAGGAKPDADLESINVAAKAVDGEQIYVPHKVAEPVAKAAEVERIVPRIRGGLIQPSYSIRPIEPDMPSTLGGSLSSASSTPYHESKAKASGPVSLGTASEAQLETLPGVGPATAQKIIAYRQEHGGFGSIEEIQSVKGIGPKKFEKMKPFLKL